MKHKLTPSQINFIVQSYKKGKGRVSITKTFNRKYGTDFTQYSMRRVIEKCTENVEKDIPKVLLLDIETAPMKAWVWGTFKQFIPLNMLISDWFILSWSAKWASDPDGKVMYKDQRGKSEKNLQNDKDLLKPLWKLMDEADIIIYQNGDKFDLPRLKTRFLMNGMGDPSEFETIDTLKIARRHFSFTSNKLEFMTQKLCTKYKKQDHSDFAGFKLWDECMKGNPKAWDSMEKYNKYDVLSLEELFLKLAPFSKTIKVTSALRAFKRK